MDTEPLRRPTKNLGRGGAQRSSVFPSVFIRVDFFSGSDFDFGRGEDGGVDAGAARQGDAAGAPAAVLQHAAEWRLTVDVAGEADTGLVERGGDFDLGAVLFGEDALDAHALVQRFAAVGMNGAHGRTDLRVAVRA